MAGLLEFRERFPNSRPTFGMRVRFQGYQGILEWLVGLTMRIDYLLVENHTVLQGLEGHMVPWYHASVCVYHDPRSSVF